MKSLQSVALLLVALTFIGCDSDPKVARQKYLETGNRYFKNEKYREASIFYRKALQKDARFGEAYYQLGLSELKLGKPADAMRALQRAVELDKANIDAASKLAEIYLAIYARSEAKPKNLLKEIEDISKRLLDKDPKSFDGLRLQGFLRLADNDLKGAVESFQSADRIKPYQRELGTVLFQTLVQDGQFDAAVTYANAALAKDKEFVAMYDVLYAEYAKKEMINEAESVLKTKMAGNPKLYTTRIQLAAHFFAAKQFDKMTAVLDDYLKLGKEVEKPRLMVGDFYFKIRDFDRSLTQFEAGAKEDSANKHEYQKRIVETYVNMNKKTDAVRMVEQILKEDPKDNEATAMRAALLLQSGTKEQVETAVSDLQGAVSRAPTNHVLRLNLAKAFLARGNAEEARIQLQEALKIRPDFQIAKIALSQIYLQRNEFGKALEYANQVLTFDSNDVRGRLLRATALVGSKDLTSARRDIDAVLARYPNLNDALYMLATIQLQTNEQAEAQATFEKMMKVNPSDVRGLLGRVETLLQVNKGPEALAVIEAELAKAPERNDIRNALANTSVRVGNYSKAIPEFLKLLASAPKDPSLVLRLAETYKRNGDDENAIKYFRQARELMPTDPTPTLQLAMILDKNGKGAESRPIYEQVLKVDPGNVLALNNMAYLLAETGQDLDLALTYAERAKQKLPSNIDVADTLGWIYIKKNLADQAISVFTDLVKKDPNRSTFHYHLAVALFQKGDKPGAKKAAQTALAKAPSAAELAKIKELIAKCG
jgi:tetratricopeptide (TPR) repeat protein